MPVLPQSQSLEAMREQVQAALNNVACSCNPLAATCECADSMPNCKCNDMYTWIRDLFPNKVVYSMNGKMYQRDFKLTSKGINLTGEPIEVELAYKPLGESHRILVTSRESFQEGAYNAKSGDLNITVIKPGFNKSKERYYPAGVLKRDFKVFEGAKMFADHATESENRSRPEGSVNNWVANVKKVWAESDGTIKGTVAVIDPPFKAKLEELDKQGMLHEMGVSIRAVGEASEAEIAGTKTNMVESLVRARSVDFVTFAGAGGQAESFVESTPDENDLDLVTEAQLRERRPDLVALIESNSLEGNVNKSLEQQLQEAQAALATEKTRADAAEAKFAEADRNQKKAAAATELEKLLSESKLPDQAKTRIRTQFKEAEKVDGMKEAITAELEYIKSIGGNGSGVRNMGEKDNGTETTESNRGGGEDQKKELLESFKLMGLSEEQAKIAAGV